MKKIAFQGRHGAYSDIACRDHYPDFETYPCPSFADALRAVGRGDADLGMIPIDNSIAGRVADIHHFLPDAGLHIVGEVFQPIHHCLLAIRGAKIDQIRKIYSHSHALPQCRNIIEKHNFDAQTYGDTAQSAKYVSDMGDKACAAIGSKLAAKLYDLDILKDNIEDEKNNTTRFIVLARDGKMEKYVPDIDYITSIVFRLRSIPAALYKAMGGFATNGINLSKLESYMLGGKFKAVQFMCDLEGHPDQKSMQLALDELTFFAEDIKILGTYRAASFRKK
jgi:prephenate dehydratase